MAERAERNSVLSLKTKLPTVQQTASLKHIWNLLPLLRVGPSHLHLLVESLSFLSWYPKASLRRRNISLEFKLDRIFPRT